MHEPLGSTVGEVLVVGGGIAGIQASLDLAEMGFRVYLVESKPSIGGRMAQLDKTFPTLDCASCILTPKMSEVARNPNIEIISYAEVVSLRKIGDSFEAIVQRRPRYVDWDKCVGCGICMEKCPVGKTGGVRDEFNEGLGARPAIYILFPQAVPRKAVIDPNTCLWFTKGICRACEKLCPANAINFEDEGETIRLLVDAVIVTTGYKFVDPRHPALKMFGYGVYDNVYTNIEFERLLDARGPTGGALIRRSDGKHPRRIVFIQCVGSRDERINPFCSAYCCMASIKQAILAKEHEPGVETIILYMDIRAFGKGFQEFYERAIREFGVKFVRGRPAKVVENPETKNLIIKYEDTAENTLKEIEADMVVLAIGVIPNPPAFLKELGIVDEYGRVITRAPEDPVSTPIEGLFVAGMLASPKDIPDSIAETSAAAARVAEYIYSKKLMATALGVSSIG